MDSEFAPQSPILGEQENQSPSERPTDTLPEGRLGGKCVSLDALRRISDRLLAKFFLKFLVCILTLQLGKGISKDYVKKRLVMYSPWLQGFVFS